MSKKKEIDEIFNWTEEELQKCYNRLITFCKSTDFLKQSDSYKTCVTNYHTCYNLMIYNDKASLGLLPGEEYPKNKNGLLRFIDESKLNGEISDTNEDTN